MTQALPNVLPWPCLALLLLAAGYGRADEYVFPQVKKEHWAWKVPTRPALPAVRNPAWVQTPMDAFILARLEAEGLTPAPPATREQLLRRVTFDLTGLPPTLAEIDAFLADRSPRAYEKVLDRLLSSPHYGERWGRHWLDVARFAESNGYEHDEVRPDAWRYRDYVIEAFNQDRPYDRFIREQLAGDELYPDNPAALVATGFNLLGPDMTDSADQAQRRQNTLNDMTDTAGLTFLGLTLACARCHDHKFEPIPQADYYRFQAFFTPAAFRTDLPVIPGERRASYEAALKAYQAHVRPLEEEIAQLEAPYRKQLYEAKLAKIADEAQVAHKTPESQRTAVQKALVEKTNRFLTIRPQEVVALLSETDRARHRQLQDEIKRFEGKKPPAPPTAMGLQDAGPQAPQTFLLERGEISNRATEVVPSFPLVCSPGFTSRPAPVVPRPTSTGRRAALAAWVASPDNPLTARVMVNRIWQHHFGKGIVATPSDFGTRGALPTHPELLDWLATEFVRQGWSIKAMHKVMLLSATYQQSSRASPEALARDPDNVLLGRMHRLRLEGEVVRDSLLALGGRLNLALGGPGVFPPLPPEATKTTKGWKVSADPRDQVRRSIYVFAGRNLPLPFLQVFDLPDSNLSCPQREQSTTAPQALALLNAGEVLEAARSLAARLEQEVPTPEERIERAYRLTLARRPTAAEQVMAREFLSQAPLSELCRALFNVNEFVYLD